MVKPVFTYIHYSFTILSTHTLIFPVDQIITNTWLSLMCFCNLIKKTPSAGIGPRPLQGQAPDALLMEFATQETGEQTDEPVRQLLYIAYNNIQTKIAH